MKYLKSSIVALSLISGFIMTGCGGGSGGTSNKQPVANAGHDIDINVDSNAQFDASLSKDIDGSIVSYEWKEGATVLSSAKSFEKNDFSIGSHSITLNVTDNEGASASDQLELIVRETKLVFLKDDKHGVEPWMTNGTAAGTYLVKDINQQQQSSTPTDFVWVGDTLFFSAADDKHGTELWVSDGTTAGTRLLKDIAPGTRGSKPRRLKRVGDRLFFVAKGGLWISDGTETGTIPLKDFNAPYEGISRLREINGVVYFAARDKTYGSELWRSDGTEFGTKMVKDINEGSGNSVSSIEMSSFVMNENLYFQTYFDNSHQLWKSDGTEDGTVKLKDIRLQRKPFIEPIIINNTHYFVATDGVHGFEMWKTDGTEAGTKMVKDIAIGDRSSLENAGYHYPVFAVVNDTLIFHAFDRTNGYEIWKTDGTEAGTQILKDLYSDYQGSGNIGGVVAHKNEVYFYSKGYRKPTSLWKTDGTEAGTKLIKTGVGDRQRLYSAGDYVYFTHQKKLWKSDGTENGTLIVKNNLTLRSFNYDNLNPIIKIADHNGVIYFSANDDTHGYELWKSDGTEAGTVMIKDINTATHDSAESDTNIYKKGQFYYFAANSKSDHYQFWKVGLWRTDGTESGTTLVKDFNLDSSFYYGKFKPSQLVQAGNNFYFPANGGGGKELWKSDGTVLGTTLLKDIQPGEGGSNPENLISKEGKIFFTTGYYSNQSLWTTDGTNEGTISILTNTNIYKKMEIINGELYFSQNRNTGGRNTNKAELWKSDGTSAGTKLIKEIDIDDSIINLVELRNKLHFTINDQLWKSDGTETGTMQVKDFDIEENTYTQYIKPLIVFNSKLYFRAYDSIDGYNFWVSDGSSSGTEVISDIAIDSFTGFIASDNLLYFASYENGLKALWGSDGTKNGTLKLKNTFQDMHGSFEGGALFTADDGDGVTLWRTNGTETGTEMVKPLY